MKPLTKTLRDFYLKKAQQKINDDFVELYNFTKSKGLDCSFEKLSGENEAQHIYEVAKKMWEADGYEEQPTSFSSVKERENRFITQILSDEIVKESNEMHDKSFLDKIDAIVDKKTKKFNPDEIAKDLTSVQPLHNQKEVCDAINTLWDITVNKKKTIIIKSNKKSNRKKK